MLHNITSIQEIIAQNLGNFSHHNRLKQFLVRMSVTAVNLTGVVKNIQVYSRMNLYQKKYNITDQFSNSKLLSDYHIREKKKNQPHLELES